MGVSCTEAPGALTALESYLILLCSLLGLRARFMTASEHRFGTSFCRRTSERNVSRASDVVVDVRLTSFYFVSTDSVQSFTIVKFLKNGVLKFLRLAPIFT